MTDPDEMLISEPIQPVAGTFDAAAMARGEAGCPGRFTWRGGEYETVAVLEQWITTSPEGGSGEVYLRRHWFKLRTTDGRVMTLYCLRQRSSGRRGGKADKARWFLYAVQGDPA